VQSILPGLICLVIALVLVFGSDIAAIGTDSLGATAASRADEYMDFVLNKIAERPWLGYGYGIFWLGLRRSGRSLWYCRSNLNCMPTTGISS